MIRQVGSDEAGRIIQLLRQLWPERHLEVAAVSAMVKRYLEDPDYWIFRHEDEGVLWGMITISFRWSFFYGGQAAIIEDLVVEESHRGQGIGTGLVRFVENEIAVQKRACVIEVNSDLQRERAHAFWEKCGYSRQAFQLRREVL